MVMKWALYEIMNNAANEKKKDGTGRDKRKPHSDFGFVWVIGAIQSGNGKRCSRRYASCHPIEGFRCWYFFQVVYDT